VAGGELAFFDKGPEFVDLDLGEGEIPDERGADHGTMLSRQCEPVQDAIRGVARETCRRPQAVALDQ
jgi:hypothetical protein